MKLKSLVVFVAVLLMGGCASSSKNEKSFDSQLYDGKPVETLMMTDPPKTEKEAIERGDKAIRENNQDLALFEYIRSLDFKDGQYKDKTLYTIGRIHQSRNNYSLAEKAYFLALKANPDNVAVLQQIGSNFSKQGETKQGAVYFIRAINADQVRLKSREKLERDSLGEVQIHALKSDEQSPAMAYMGLGIISDLDGKHSLAQRFFKKALKIKPDSMMLLLNIGYSYYMSGDLEEAKRSTLAALDHAPNNPKAINNLALIYLAQGSTFKALNTFKRHMKDYEALNNVGYFLILQGKAEEAVTYLQQAIDKKSSYYPLANENLERALAEIKQDSIDNKKTR
ncbi:photosystem I assembly protein Ycf3 [Vibrio aerogenes CECT 7868]|uniref:Photosystem I assembly protein Ycf3 n=1 Tax=Vibrio aerogenes CECT 7868 TaxID=1216006 RepID=A0A1M5ZG94_9VIBR|nr:tetratricopeptide repeat protein [Vibrio aerogenes]SHI23230.1 photosystem I assembly protein Ycf3 [Vibrio aerogenes CECT 7868]